MDDKLKNLIHEADKKYGKGTIITGNEVPQVPILCSTGSYKLDLAIGCGGIPAGKIIEAFGPPSGGKSSLALTMLSNIQKAGLIGALIDVENSYDPEWSSNLGVDNDKLLYHQPASGDEALDICDMMIKSNSVSFVIIDSVAALVTKAELEGEMGDAHMAQLARLMSQSLKKLNASLSNSKCTILYINQVRSGMDKYKPEISVGGISLKFYAHLRLDIRRGDVIGDKEDPEGFVTKIKVAKNKVGRPFQKVETDLFIGPNKFGIDYYSEILDLASQHNIVKKAGAGWYSYNEERVGQGKENVVEILKNNPTMFDEIKTAVFKTVLTKSAPESNSFNAVTNEIVDEEPKKRGRKKKEDEGNFEEINIKPTEPVEVFPEPTKE